MALVAERDIQAKRPSRQSEMPGRALGIQAHVVIALMSFASSRLITGGSVPQPLNRLQSLMKFRVRRPFPGLAAP